MKRRLAPHPNAGGPSININLADVSIIEEYGSRDSGSGWIEAVITLRAGKELKIKLPPEDMDALIEEWEDRPPNA